MATKTDIWNMALMDLGISEAVADLDTEESKAARVGRRLYESVRDHVLQEFPWSFATRRVTLALLASDPPTNWDYAYRLPTDCIQPQGLVVSGLRTPRNAQRIPYEVSADDDGRVIYTDLEDAELLYTARVEDTGQYDPMFIMALVAMLASKGAMPMSVKPEIAANAAKAYVNILHNAAAHSLNQSNPGVEPDSEFLAIRGVTPDEAWSIYRG